LICDINGKWCDSMANASTAASENQTLWQQVMSSVTLNTGKMKAIQNTYSRQLAAFRICTLVMWITTLPALCLMVAILVVSSAVSLSVLAVIPALFSAIAQTIAFHKTPS
jgi:uncharacterized membrane-anchored protein